MKYRVYYKCQMCGVRFFYNYDRDELVRMASPLPDNFDKNLLKDNEFLTLIFKRNKAHNCELDTIGQGKVVGLRRLTEKDVA